MWMTTKTKMKVDEKTWTRTSLHRKVTPPPPHPLPSLLLTSQNLVSLLAYNTICLALINIDVSCLHLGAAVLSSMGSTETGPTGDFGGNNLDKIRMSGIVEDARSLLLELTGAFVSRVVILDLRIKKVFAKHIVEASVDVDA
jgi:hypothetical protein